MLDEVDSNEFPLHHQLGSAKTVAPGSRLRRESTMNVAEGTSLADGDDDSAVEQTPSSSANGVPLPPSAMISRSRSRKPPTSLLERVPSELYTRFPRFANTTGKTLPDLLVDEVISTRLSADEQCILQGGQDEDDDDLILAGGSRRLRDAWRKAMRRQNERLTSAARKLKTSSSSLCSQEMPSSPEGRKASLHDLDEATVPKAMSTTTSSPGTGQFCAGVGHGRWDDRRKMFKQLSPLQESSPVTTRALTTEHLPAPSTQKEESCFVPLPQVQLPTRLHSIPSPDLGHVGAASQERTVSGTSIAGSERYILRSASMNNVHDLPRSHLAISQYSVWSSSNTSLRKVSPASLNYTPLVRPVSRPDSVYDYNSLRSFSHLRQGPVFVGLPEDQAVHFVFPAELETIPDNCSIISGHGRIPPVMFGPRQDQDAPLLVRSSILKQAYEQDESHHKVARYVPSMILRPAIDPTSSYLQSLWHPVPDKEDVTDDSDETHSDPGSTVCQANRSLCEQWGIGSDEDRSAFRATIWLKACKFMIDSLPGCRGFSERIRFLNAGAMESHRVRESRPVRVREEA